MENRIPKEELLYMKVEILDKIGPTTLDSRFVDAVWNGFRRLFPTDTMNRPCSCGSAGKYWAQIIERSRVEVSRLLAEYENEVKVEVVEPENGITFTPVKKSKKK